MYSKPSSTFLSISYIKHQSKQWTNKENQKFQDFLTKLVKITEYWASRVGLASLYFFTSKSHNGEELRSLLTCWTILETLLETPTVWKIKLRRTVNFIGRSKANTKSGQSQVIRQVGLNTNNGGRFIHPVSNFYWNLREGNSYKSRLILFFLSLQVPAINSKLSISSEER